MSTHSDVETFATELTLTQPQNDFLQLDCPFPAFVAGFGSGKSQTMAVSATMDACEAGADGVIAILEPTLDLCKKIAYPRIQMILAELGIRSKLNKSDQMIYTSHPGIGDFLFRSMDNPARLVGWESFRSHLDELDTLRKSDAKEVWLAMIARSRQVVDDYLPFNFLSPDRPLNRVSAYCTPEGFNFLYGRWGKDKARAHRNGYHMVQAATMTNPFLPANYLDNMRGSYDAKRFEAYANGLFVNLTGGSIYHSFDRHLNGCTTMASPGEPLHIGQDFNIGKMASVVYVKRWADDGVEELHAVGEIAKGLDTPAVITTLQERYAGHHISVYPDASGQHGSTKCASQSDVDMLRQAGFDVLVNPSNPRVKDRISSMNGMICNADGRRRLKVNEKECPEYVECLEQQIFDPKTNQPDKKGGKDHQNDAGGYPVVYMYPITKPNIGTVEVDFY